MDTFDRERIQQWVVASSRARPGCVSAQRAKPSTGSSVNHSGSALEALLETTTTSSQDQVQSAWDINICTFISHAESAYIVARDTCAALISLEQKKQSSKPTPSTCSPFQPSTAMLFSQYEKSRRAKRLHNLMADDASGLSTAPALSDVHSVHNSSRVTASSRGVPGLSASRQV
jgi:hypothetical protein